MLRLGSMRFGAWIQIHFICYTTCAALTCRAAGSGSYYNCRRGRLQWLKAMKGRYNLSKGAALRKKQKKRPLRGRFSIYSL
jgi:hypothetical protein